MDSFDVIPLLNQSQTTKIKRENCGRSYYARQNLADDLSGSCARECLFGTKLETVIRWPHDKCGNDNEFTCSLWVQSNLAFFQNLTTHIP